VYLARKLTGYCCVATVVDGEPPSRVHSVRGRLTCKSGCLPPARGGRVPGLLASDAQRTVAALRLFKRIAAEQATSTCASAWFWRTVFLYSALISTRATHLQHPYWPGQKPLRYACEISVFCNTFFFYQFLWPDDAPNLIIHPNMK